MAGGKKAADTVEETQPDEIDTSAAVAEISSELFGQDDAGEEKVEDQVEGEGSESSGEPSADAAKAPPQSDEAAAEAKPKEETSAEVQEVGAPKTWTKEALADWATIPDRAKAEILKREEDFLNGITQYKAAAEVGHAYNSVVEPYKPLLQAENIDPVQLFQSFAGNHYLLTRGTPAQKVQLAASLLTGYDIPLADLLNYIADNPSEAVDPKIRALENELNGLKRGISTATETHNTQVRERLVSEITQFAADPAHPYFDELADDISKLFAAGLATSLPEAYEKAIYANPSTRQKELDRLTAEKQASADAEKNARKEKRARSQADQVSTIPRSKDGTVPLGSIDDTLAETMAAIENRG